MHAGIRYSMPDQFEIEVGPQDRVIVDYRRTVIQGLGQWGRFVEGIASNVFEDFCHYMGTALFVSFSKQIVWQVRLQEFGVEGTTESAVVNPKQLPVRLRVFLPDGNKGRMYAKSGYPAKLWWDKPHARIVEMSNQVLQAHGRLDDAS